MGKTIHVCQSIEGALLHWDFDIWLEVAVQNKMTVNETKREFIKYLKEGKKVISMGKPCEGFSYQTGCPGHLTEKDK